MNEEQYVDLLRTEEEKEPKIAKMLALGEPLKVRTITCQQTFRTTLL
jgi:hypothetical protein